jgi:hypothetical protein
MHEARSGTRAWVCTWSASCTCREWELEIYRACAAPTKQQYTNKGRVRACSSIKTKLNNTCINIVTNRLGSIQPFTTMSNVVVIHPWKRNESPNDFHYIIRDHHQYITKPCAVSGVFLSLLDCHKPLFWSLTNHYIIINNICVSLTTLVLIDVYICANLAYNFSLPAWVHTQGTWGSLLVSSGELHRTFFLAKLWQLMQLPAFLLHKRADPVSEAPTRVGSGEGNNRSKVLPPQKFCRETASNPGPGDSAS